MGNQWAQIVNHFLPEPIGSPLVAQKSPHLPPGVEPWGNQRAEILNHFLPEPIGSPLVRLLLTKGMIACGFSGRPDGYSGWTCPPKRTDSRKLWAFSFWLQ